MPRRPQDPVPPFPYDERDVSYEGASPEITLAGTLTLPRAVPKAPAALFVTGSGPQDRNEEVAGHRPFLVLADHLTRRGFATLRADDRGVGGSTGDDTQATQEDLARDVARGLAFLRQYEAVDPSRIGLIGHSEGALVAAMAAAQDPELAFLVMLAGPGLPGIDAIHMQSALLARSRGADEAAILRERRMNERVFAAVLAAPNTGAAFEMGKRVLLEELAALPEDERPADDEIERTAETMVTIVSAPSFTSFLRGGPAPFLRAVRCPVLALGGSLDLQAPAREHLAGITAALEAGGNPRAEVIELPGLNHLFQTAVTGALEEYEQIEETFAPAAMQRIAAWLSAWE
ncbi:alpha/beta hydrolase family protein [Polyangium jinanense]|uniref:Alpha/beta fold hydrolase n=1 Tax=Polyangium jinanense TaxID=2829994 RepID=A0A9X3XEZ3_9BACT|nr:alpha/beta fold hydrolase [Polyangium jinanense]MDC3988195.1 alpha/beta fold hydrolase [Polyangium jinanense]